MVETWIYIIGGLIVAVIAFVIAYNLMTSSMEFSQRQNFLNEFSSFYSDVDTVCNQEMNSSLERKISIPSSVRVIYATNDVYYALPNVTDLIKKQKLSSGQHICLQFNNEKESRCYPENLNNMSCNISMPYIGTLQESEDIWVRVSKILGKPPIKTYYLSIQKIEDNIYISFSGEVSITTTSTTITTTTIKKECPFECCENEKIYKDKLCPSGQSCLSEICQ